MYEKLFVKGKQKRAFLNYLVKQNYINKGDISSKMSKGEKDIIKKAGFADALFFQSKYTDKGWKREYLQVVGKKFKVSVTMYDAYGDISNKRDRFKIV